MDFCFTFSYLKCCQAGSLAAIHFLYKQSLSVFQTDLQMDIQHTAIKTRRRQLLNAPKFKRTAWGFKPSDLVNF
jgi:hypothetical protein